MKITELVSSIVEATEPYANPFEPEEDIGLMTLKEFLWMRNTQGKSHDDDVYTTTLLTMNRPDRTRGYDISHYMEYKHSNFRGKSVVANAYTDGMIINVDNNPVAVFKDDVFYHTIAFPDRSLPINFETRDGRLIIEPKAVKKVKYIDEYVASVTKIAERNRSAFPAIMQRIKVGDETCTIRTKVLPYKKNSGQTIVILNKDDYIIATASDEWGATLLRVVLEYRGKDLGKVIGTIWYKNNPSFPSGGFSPSGKSNAIKIWSGRVREMLQSGMYSNLVQQGVLSKDRVKEIISWLPEKKVKQTPSPKKSETPELLLYTDMDTMFVLYDKKFFNAFEEKYVYAHAFLRETNGKMYIYTLDYDKPFRKLATFIIFQIAYDTNTKLYIESPPSDHLEISDIEEIEIDDNNFAFITSPVINLKPYMEAEKTYRSKHDKFDHAYYMLLDIANSKWE